MKSAAGRTSSRTGKGSILARLARLEEQADRKKDATDPLATVFARMAAYGKREVAPENQPIVAAFDAYFAATFPAMSSLEPEQRFSSWGFSALTAVQYAAFRRLAKEMFANWLAGAFPDRPQRDDDRITFESEINRLAERMYLEVATDQVPRRQRQFYFDPDHFIEGTFRPDLWNPPRKFRVVTLKLLYRPSGTLLKRARAFTRIHERREGKVMDMTGW